MKMYECQRCLRRFGLKKIVMINCFLPVGKEEFDLCLDCYNDSKLKVDPNSNHFAIRKRIHKKFNKDVK